MDLNTQVAVIAAAVALLGFLLEVLKYFVPAPNPPTAIRFLRALPLYLLFCSLAFIVGFLFEKNGRPVTIVMPATSGAASTTYDVTLNSARFTYPHILSAEGTHRGLPDNFEVRVYVTPEDGKTYMKQTRTLPDGTWQTIGRVDVGSRGRFGGTYVVGIAVGDPTTCPEMSNYAGFDGNPMCAEVIDWVRVER